LIPSVVEVESHVLRLGRGDQPNGHVTSPQLSVPVYTAVGTPPSYSEALALARRLEAVAQGTSLIPEHEEDR
jgi:hypothetical protein